MLNHAVVVVASVAVVLWACSGGDEPSSLLRGAFHQTYPAGLALVAVDRGEDGIACSGGALSCPNGCLFFFLSDTRAGRYEFRGQGLECYDTGDCVPGEEQVIAEITGSGPAGKVAGTGGSLEAEEAFTEPTVHGTATARLEDGTTLGGPFLSTRCAFDN